MSFRLFIYYCAVCGGWAAFLAWAVVWGVGINDVASPLLRAGLIGAVVGGLVAGAIGFVDARLNAVGRQRLTRVIICAGLGLAGGLAGGLIGQGLTILQRSLPAVLAWAPLCLGWILAGVLIGASVGVYDLVRARLAGEDSYASLRKTVNGILGGLLGGGVGGAFFGVLSVSGAEALPHSGLTVGLVILGVSIGLLVGLAQVILKEAWLKVEEGFRAGRELMLTRDVTTIGRAEGCDVGLFGDHTIEKQHARILLEGNRYLLADAGSAGGTYLNDEPVGGPTPLRSGDLIRVGRSILRFGERQKRTED
jgi:hypothetical protein